MATISGEQSTGRKAHAVTGAFGFTGKYVARRLLAAGHRVVTYTGSPRKEDPFDGQVEVRLFNFNDASAMAESLKDVQVLYNTYWVRFNHPRFSHADAVRNSLALFEAAKMAGVERLVHVSIANADPHSPLEYFRSKGRLEEALKVLGLNYAVVRPAVLFGAEGILINNIAWTLRRLPVCGIFGDGKYHVQPIHVDDVAAIMVEQGQSREFNLINALGPEDFTYRELVDMIGAAIGKKRPIISVPPSLGYAFAWAIGKLMDDVFVTRDEITGLMADLLHVPGQPATGSTRLSDWIRQNADTLGRVYFSELARRVPGK